jgi:hypothetical protein
MKTKKKNIIQSIIIAALGFAAGQYCPVAAPFIKPAVEQIIGPKAQESPEPEEPKEKPVPSAVEPSSKPEEGVEQRADSK